MLTKVGRENGRERQRLRERTNTTNGDLKALSIIDNRKMASIYGNDMVNIIS